MPRPVTGSHPGTASKPTVPHPGLLPLVMSLSTLGFEYRTGLTKPTGALPMARRASLIRLTMEAKIGVPVEREEVD